MTVVTVERKILEKNDEVAQRNRELFRSRKLLVINVVSSPGAGKTSVLERTLEHLQGSLSVAVIEGDVQTDLDARRIARYNIPTAQIVPHGGCHLEAKLVEDAIASMDLTGIRLLIVENVGNLVCPANYDLGEHFKVVVASTPEGDDKPLKYPGMFRNAQVLIINKIDLAPHLDVSISTLRSNALKVNPTLRIFETSCRTGEGIPAWSDWLAEKASSL